ncbi:hypothetical protein GGX14DRAFT_401184 [Mycena pura]|uniref:Myb/SANT-like domain-containing protein n=1 Tax=Mycena pura TaxID=153505 RepID=A0AAD6Y3K4_9AGAR|nr:hypothetical protein GGX14DRAFT_401184 [Mycena pura]
MTGLTVAQDQALLGTLYELRATHRSGNGWKPQAWTEVLAAVNKAQPNDPKTTSQVQARTNYLKTRYFDYVFCMKYSGVGWDDEAKHCTATQEYQTEFLQVHGPAALFPHGVVGSLNNRPFIQSSCASRPAPCPPSRSCLAQTFGALSVLESKCAAAHQLVQRSPFYPSSFASALPHPLPPPVQQRELQLLRPHRAPSALRHPSPSALQQQLVPLPWPWPRLTCPFHDLLEKIYEGGKNCATGAQVLHLGYTAKRVAAAQAKRNKENQPADINLDDEDDADANVDEAPLEKAAKFKSKSKSKSKTKAAAAPLGKDLSSDGGKKSTADAMGDAVGALLEPLEVSSDDELVVPPSMALRSEPSRKRIRADSEGEDDDANTPHERRRRSKSSSSSSAKSKIDATNNFARSVDSLATAFTQPVVVRDDLSYIALVNKILQEDPTLLPADDDGSYYSCIRATSPKILLHPCTTMPVLTGTAPV